MKLSAIVSIFALVLAACAPHDATELFDPVPKPEVCDMKPAPCTVASYQILIDNQISPSKRQLVYQAAAEWSVRTGDTLSLSFLVLPTESLHDDPDHAGIVSVFLHYPGDGFLGWCAWNSGAKIYMLDGLTDEYFLTVVRHELGHAFHLQHYTGPNPAIMHPGVASGQDISCQDLTDFCEQWKCQSNVKCNPDELQIPEVVVKPSIASFPEPIETQVCGLAP